MNTRQKPRAHPLAPLSEVGGPLYLFDYRSFAQSLSLSPKEIAMLEKQVRNDFPHDDMLRELHLLRAIKAYACGKRTTANG